MPLLALIGPWLAKSVLMQSPLGAIIYGIGRFLKAFFKMLDWQGWVGLIASAFLAWHWLGASIDARHWHKQADQNAKALTVCQKGRTADREAYTKAQAEAASQNRAQVTKIEQQSQRISDDERQAYLGDLAKLRADNQRLRAHSTAKGSADTAGSSTAPAPASGVDGSGEVRLSAEEFLRAQEIELQLMHLEAWVNKQLAIDPNEPTEPQAR